MLCKNYKINFGMYIVDVMLFQKQLFVDIDIEEEESLFWNSNILVFIFMGVVCLWKLIKILIKFCIELFVISEKEVVLEMVIEKKYEFIY